MSEILSWIPCVCAGLKLAYDQIVNLEVKFRTNDETVAHDLAKLTEDIKKYNKKDRDIIIKFVKRYMDEQVSILTANNSADETKDDRSVVTEVNNSH